jgi:F0F1-type ATP synthase assembly protein I
MLEETKQYKQPLWHDSDLIKAAIVGAIIGLAVGLVVGYDLGLPDINFYQPTYLRG